MICRWRSCRKSHRLVELHLHTTQHNGHICVTSQYLFQCNRPDMSRFVPQTRPHKWMNRSWTSLMVVGFEATCGELGPVSARKDARSRPGLQLGAAQTHGSASGEGRDRWQPRSRVVCEGRDAILVASGFVCHCRLGPRTRRGDSWWRDCSRLLGYTCGPKQSLGLFALDSSRDTTKNDGMVS
jgi:hypothetical protein